ncbi:MAG: hypothetical protein M1825_002555 [Sarcosagium campestre]|nr:MAG: hypothetical protein M1825_002555 [Sarcosagium campestre]
MLKQLQPQLHLPFHGQNHLHRRPPPWPRPLHPPPLLPPPPSWRRTRFTAASSSGSTRSDPSSTAPLTSPQSPPPNSRGGGRVRPHGVRRFPAYLFIGGGSLMLGLTLGTMFQPLVFPAPLAEPGTLLDRSRIERLGREAAALPEAQALRASGQWREWDAYSSLSPAQRAGRLSSGPMSGSRGLAVQKIFCQDPDQNQDQGSPTTTESKDEKKGGTKTISFVYLGGALIGWPGVIHGGAIATLLDESLGRVAIRALAAATGVTANLELDYRAPVHAGAFYVVRAQQDEAESTPAKAVVRGTLETLDGRVCVQAKGLFVTPKGFALGKIDPGF